MNTALFYDTETTGVPLFSEPSEDPRQPHIVQLAATLVDLDTREIVSSMDVIVRPTDWIIPDDVAAVHGIATDKAMEVGIPEEMALTLLMNLWDNRTRIGHNETFDARIIRIAQHRFGYSETLLTGWKEGRAECTARLSTPIVKCPPHGQDARGQPLPLQNADPGRGLRAFHGQAAGERPQRHGRRAGLHGGVFRHEGSRGRRTFHDLMHPERAASQSIAAIRMQVER